MVSDLVSRMLFCYAVHVHIRAYVDDVLSLAWLFMHCPVRTKRSRLPKLLFFPPKPAAGHASFVPGFILLCFCCLLKSYFYTTSRMHTIGWEYPALSR